MSIFLIYDHQSDGRFVAALEGETHFMLGSAATRDEALAYARRVQPGGRHRTGRLEKIKISLDGLSGMILGELKRRADSGMPEGHPFDCGWPDGAGKADRAELDDLLADAVQEWVEKRSLLPMTLTVVDIVHHGEA